MYTVHSSNFRLHFRTIYTCVLICFPACLPHICQDWIPLNSMPLRLSSSDLLVSSRDRRERERLLHQLPLSTIWPRSTDQRKPKNDFVHVHCTWVNLESTVVSVHFGERAKDSNNFCAFHWPHQMVMYTSRVVQCHSTLLLCRETPLHVYCTTWLWGLLSVALLPAIPMVVIVGTCMLGGAWIQALLSCYSVYNSCICLMIRSMSSFHDSSCALSLSTVRSLSVLPVTLP